MGNVVHWVDMGREGYRVYIDIPLRKNGLPPIAAAQAASNLLEAFNPAAFDPPEPVPELVARAAQRDGIVPEYVVMTENHPPVPVYEEDEIPGPRCQSGVCLGD